MLSPRKLSWNIWTRFFPSWWCFPPRNQELLLVKTEERRRYIRLGEPCVKHLVTYGFTIYKHLLLPDLSKVFIQKSWSSTRRRSRVVCLKSRKQIDDSWSPAVDKSSTSMFCLGSRCGGSPHPSLNLACLLWTSTDIPTQIWSLANLAFLLNSPLIPSIGSSPFYEPGRFPSPWWPIFCLFRWRCVCLGAVVSSQ